MKVLVTGASGFLGRHIVPQLLARGHSVVAVARNEAKARSLDWFDNVRFHARDIHQEIIDPAEQFGYPDALVHLAWPGLPNYNELFHFEENLPADYRFLKELIKGGVRQVLVAGTCFEYGMREGCVTEDMCTQPENSYALAKDTLRRTLRELQRHQTFTLQWTRMFYMYGPGQNPDSLLARLEHAISQRETVFEMSNGEQLRDYLPVEEVARRVVLVAENPAIEGTINICSGKPISIRRLAEEYVARQGANIHLSLGRQAQREYEPVAFWGSSVVFDTDGSLL